MWYTVSKILVLCNQGNNRSVTIAHLIKYLGHDVIAAGLDTNSPATLAMLGDWADKIILTDGTQHLAGYDHKTQLWDIGPDTYPRPFNKELLAKVRALVEQHRANL